MDIRTLIGKRIKKLRADKKLSQLNLAGISDLDRTYINSVENGRRNISIVNIKKICSALNVSLKEFFESNEFNNNK